LSINTAATAAATASATVVERAAGFRMGCFGCCLKSAAGFGAAEGAARRRRCLSSEDEPGHYFSGGGLPSNSEGHPLAKRQPLHFSRRRSTQPPQQLRRSSVSWDRPDTWRPRPEARPNAQKHGITARRPILFKTQKRTAPARRFLLLKNAGILLQARISNILTDF
jgi:hypothetical protein